MNKTGFLYHPVYLEHQTGAHPENFGRLNAINQRLQNSDIQAKLIFPEVRPATVEDIARIHDTRYIEQVERACAEGVARLDADTAISSRSYEAAVMAAGAAVTAVDRVFDGTCDNVFCAVRPPGHHAERSRAMGFCLFNNVAVAARYAQSAKGAERVFIFDWDVHHGNGTQHSFYSDPTVFYCSIHQFPFYPGTGDRTETGSGKGLGTTLNFPLRAYTGDEDYLAIVQDKVVPEIIRYKPNLVVISAGFDAHRDDPLASMEVSTECFGTMTRLIRSAAQEVCQGRLISMLEGGYNPEALGESVYAHLQNLIL